MTSEPILRKAKSYHLKMTSVPIKNDISFNINTKTHPTLNCANLKWHIQNLTVQIKNDICLPLTPKLGRRMFDLRGGGGGGRIPTKARAYLPIASDSETIYVCLSCPERSLMKVKT